MANHQVNAVVLGTAGALAESQRGPIIMIMNEYAILQEQCSIHSCVQLEYHKNIIEDRYLKAKGLQRITTHDGYVFPLDIINGLPYLKMRPYTDEEFELYPHVIMTSDHPWRYIALDCTLSVKADWYQNVSDWSDGMMDSPFDLEGNYSLASDPINLNIHEMIDSNKWYATQPMEDCNHD